MKRKKAFLFSAVIFAMMLGYASYDISTRTTFPGSKGQLKERLNKKYELTDTVSSDSTQK
jgi:hypothetical protein